MKNKHVLVLTGLFLMVFFKRSLLPVDSTFLYSITNIIGALMLLIYFFKKKTPLTFAIFLYIGLNLIFYLLNYYQVSILPVASGLILFFQSLIFLFPNVALLFYLYTFDTELRLVQTEKKLMKISLSITLLALFLFLTGVFSYYSLSIVAMIVVAVQILELRTLLVLSIYISRNPQTQPKN